MDTPDNTGSGSSAPASRLVVLMFTDLVGSTELKDSLGTAGYLPLLRRHDALLRRAVGAVNGRLQQDTGDGCFAVFPTSSDAVRAGLLFQKLMHDEAWPDGAELSTRIGIHLGEVAETDVRQDGGKKMVGLAVDLTARLMSLATSGQILMTRGAFDDSRQFISGDSEEKSGALIWMAHGPYLFKGAEEALEVFEVGVKGQAPLSPPPDSEKARRALRAGDEQTLGWRPAIGLALPSSPHWMVEKKLGEGGFGEVWLARHIKSKAERVFKFCFDAERLRALKREVVLFRLLKEALGDRRDIARVIDWQFDQPPYYIELDYTPAGNLFDWATSVGGIEKVLLADRLGIVARIAVALSAAHSVGILHKDIKPSNVLMVTDAADDTYPRLTDFGIGILTDRARLDQFNITAAGFTASNISVNDSSRTGTRMYAPPESLADKPHTVQGDVYALGVLLYQMAVGDLVAPLGVGWERNIADELLREDIKACVEGDPKRRLASTGELANRLENLEQRRAEATREIEQRTSAARRKRMLRLATAGAVMLVVVSSFAALALVREHGLRTRAEKAELGTLQEEKRAEDATAVALEQKALAERRFNDVRSLANTFMFQMHDSIANLAGSTPARRLLVETSLKYLVTLEAESADSPEVLREVAAGYVRVGEILEGIGSEEKAGTAARRDCLKRAVQAIEHARVILQEMRKNGKVSGDDLALEKIERARGTIAELDR